MKLTPREQQLLDFLKTHAGKTVHFQTIRESFVGPETLSFHNSLMCSVRRLKIKLSAKGNILVRLTKVGRGNKAVFFVDETILKL
jgi:DNA-binding response OmpR family regulator